MSTIKKKEISELVGGDINAGGNDRNPTNDSEIETGPYAASPDHDSEYEKGTSTTTDRVFGRYRQNIPWFAVYSYGGTRVARGLPINEEPKTTIIKKKAVEEKIDDLVKKSKDSEVTDKTYNAKVSKVLDIINDSDLTDDQLASIAKAISNKKDNPSKTKKL